MISRVQEDKSIRAIDLEFTTVYYAAHDLAYAFGGCVIKGAKAKRAFLSAYLQGISSSTPTDEEVRAHSHTCGGGQAERPLTRVVYARPSHSLSISPLSRPSHALALLALAAAQVDSLAVDAELFMLVHHCGSLAPWHIKLTEKQDGMPTLLRLLLVRLRAESIIQQCAETRADPTKLEAMLEKGLSRHLGGATGQTLDWSCIPLIKATFARDPSLVPAAISPDILKRALTPQYMPLAYALIESGADPAVAREALLADDAKLFRALVLDPNASTVVDTFCSSNPELKAIAESPEMLLAALLPSSAAAAMALLDKGAADFAVVRDGLLADDMKRLRSLLVDVKCSALVTALCAKDERIQRRPFARLSCSKSCC